MFAGVRFWGALVAALCLLGAAPAQAQKITGTAVLVPDPAGDTLDAEVTFNLPRSVWIAGSWYILPDVSLAGDHTCTIRGEHTGVDGNTMVYARLNRGKRRGSVFVARVPRDPEESLFAAGCDGDPETEDAFQGTLSAIFAGPPLYLALALDSTAEHPEGLSVEEEMRAFFEISASRTRIAPKLVEFHGPLLLNRGGSATGVGSARVSLKFKP